MSEHILEIPIPSVREYGGGDDRWCYHRHQFSRRLWDVLCDGHGEEFPFAEWSDREAAIAALLAAIRRVCFYRRAKAERQAAATPVRTVAEVQAARRSVVGCCSRHADNMACECLERAIQESKP